MVGIFFIQVYIIGYTSFMKKATTYYKQLPFCVVP